MAISNDLNEVNIMGNLGKDPELGHTQAGKPVLTLNICTNEWWDDQNGKRHERAEWHRVVVYGNRAKACSDHLRKGSRVLVRGALQSRRYTDKDGIERKVTEVMVREREGFVKFLGGKRSESNRSASTPNGYADEVEA